MPSPVTANLARVEFRYTWNAQLVENVLHFELQEGVLGNGDLQNLTGALALWWDENMFPLQCNTCMLREIYAESYGGPDDSIAYTEIVGVAGENTEETVPNNVSLVTSFRSGFTGRSRRGRSYFLGGNLNVLVSGAWSPSFAEQVRGAWAAMNSYISGFNWEHVIASLQSGGAPRLTALVTAVQAYSLVDVEVDSQRRRLPGRGS